MKLHRVIGLFLAAQLLVVTVVFGQGNYKTDTIGAAPADVPAPIQSVLDSKGVQVASDKGPLCEVWLRKSIPTAAAPNTSSEVLFGALAEGTLVGVVHFPAAAKDFRGQDLKPGFYTLRYVLIPQDGNHMGVNPYRDAFALGPVSSDPGPDKVLALADLIKLSTQASGTPHPGFLVGAQVNGTSFPAVAKDDSGHWNLQVKAHAASGDLPLAFTVVGKWEP